ncbi:MAG: TrgA family protein [Pseudomonadota bacterium]
MPTFAKAVAAVLFAALAYYVSTLVEALFFDTLRAPYMKYWNALFGLIIGWRLGGRTAGYGFGSAVGTGLTTTIALAAFCLFVNAFSHMIWRSMRNYYDGPSEALVAVVELMIEFAPIAFTMNVLAISIGGGLLIAIIVDFVGKRTT